MENIGTAVNPGFYGADALLSLRKFLHDSEDEKRQFILLTDSNTQGHCLPVLLKNIPELSSAFVISIPAGEENKNLESFNNLAAHLVEAGAKRNSFLICLGGGMITDLGAFAASVYMRGIRYGLIPTSLLGMVDAAIGGKTGINFHSAKNLLGTFSKAEFVCADPLFLQTLPEREFKSGYAEVMKHFLIANAEAWKACSLKSWPPERSWSDIIIDSAKIKLAITEQDYREIGIRKILNFGHTVGHALEAVSLSQKESSLLHGEAIALGMMMAAEISKSRTGLSEAECDSILKVLFNLFPGLDFSFSRDALITCMKLDKKSPDGSFRFVLLNRIADPVYDVEVSESSVRDAISRVHDFYLSNRQKWQERV